MSFLTVVVPTYNRAETLRVTLDRLSNQTLAKDRYEVVVVDDGSTDHTGQVVAEFQKTMPVPLTYLRHDHTGPGFTHNRAFREATGPWVLLIADDIHAEPEMLAVHYQAHEQNPEPNVAVAGKVLQSPRLPQTVFLRNWNPFRYKNFEKVEELTYINFWGCNVSFKKQFMIRYGMFAERSSVAHEDTEVGWRLYRDGGLRLLYRKEALGYHYHLETIDSACRRAYERGRNFDVLIDSITDPALYLRYHLVNSRTFPHVLRAYRTATASILDEDRNVVWFILREGLRKVIFNRLTVPYLLKPMIRHAERNRLLALLVRPLALRGVVSHHFLIGVEELRRHRAAARSPCLSMPL